MNQSVDGKVVEGADTKAAEAAAGAAATGGETKQPTDDEGWDKVSKDREAATSAAEGGTPQGLDKPAAGAEPDPLDGLPEPTRKLIEGLQKTTTEQAERLKNANQQLARVNGTMGSMKQRLDESQAQLKKITPTVDAVQAQKEAEEKAKREAQLQKRKELRERLGDLPDVLEYIDSVIPPPKDDEPAAGATDDGQPKPGEGGAPAKTDAPAESELTPDERRVLILQRELSDRVPGWMKTREEPEFKTWVSSQSADIKAKYESWDVEDAAGVFKAFEKHKSDAAEIARVEKDRQDRLSRGEGPSGRSTTNAKVDPAGEASWDRVTRDRERAKAAGTA